MKKYVTKDIFVNALTCPTFGWLLRFEEAMSPEPPTLGEIFHREQGREVELRARSLYHDGLLIADADPQVAWKKTINAIEDRSVKTVFSATFLVDGFVTKADIVQRSNGGWVLNEVKSHMVDDPEFIDDMAYTTMVAERAGLKVTASTLLLVSKDFRLGMDYSRLFNSVDHTEEVRQRVKLFEPYWETIEQITRSKKRPNAELKFICKKCILFGQCLGKGIENHIFEIPWLTSKKFDELTKNGIVSIEDIPDGFPLTDRQERVRKAVKSNKPIVEVGFRNRLENLTWPVYYLDFETVATVIPLYPEIAPYEKLPTQYSVHRCSAPGKPLQHSDFLADPSKNCSREFIENLIKALGETGSIVVYGTFEKTVLTGLLQEFRDYSAQINGIIGRIVNLQQIVSADFYHPDFHGSTSIKTVLPALVPGLSYEALDIKDGDSATAAFAYMALGRYKDEKSDEIKKSLRAYCAQDTRALYEVRQRLLQICSS